ncbi:MAG: prolipoprotein diacylglyceryl transferase [Mycoplasma sp.]|nr:prolipoprotein diacylglyceryl transferase [Mycoplasma sp.]
MKNNLLPAPGKTSPNWIIGDNGTNGPAVAFKIGNYSVHAYSLAIASAILLSILTIFYFWKRQKYSTEHLQVLILIVIPTAVICSRLWHVIYAATDKKLYSGFVASRDWYKIWEGGLSIHGAVIGAAIAGIIFLTTKRKSIDVKTALDYILPAVLIGQAIGRWGNFANHEVYGKIDQDGSTSKWLGEFISDNMFIDGHYRVPLFFYESLTSIIGAILIVFVFNIFNWQKPGTTGGMYFTWYGIVRLIMEPMRTQKDAMMWGKLNSGIFISIVYIIIGILLILNAYLSWTRWIVAFVIAIKNKKIKKIKKYLPKKQKYIRIKIEQRIFFIIWAFKIAVFFSSLWSALTAKNKKDEAQKRKEKKQNLIKGNIFMVFLQKIVLLISYAWNLMFSKDEYNKKQNINIKKYSKFKSMNWKFRTYIWVRKQERSKFK